MVGEAQSLIKPNPILTRWAPSNWEMVISQRFSDRSQTSEPHTRLPSLGVWQWEEGPSEQVALKVSRVWSQESHQPGGDRNSALGGHTCSHVHQGKSSDLTGVWVIPTCWYWKVFCGGWWHLWLTMGTKTAVALVLGSTHWHEPSQGYHFLTKTLPHPKACRLQCWDASG